MTCAVPVVVVAVVGCATATTTPYSGLLLFVGTTTADASGVLWLLWFSMSSVTVPSGTHLN